MNIFLKQVIDKNFEDDQMRLSKYVHFEKNQL